ncbi:MAG: hypothetical protein ACI4MQ_07880 [Candidatus Coproplasma sp.]
MLTDYYYNNLAASEQNAYNTIKFALDVQDAECTVSGIGSVAAAARVWNAVLLDHPEIIHYSGLFCRPAASGGNIKFRFQYTEVDRQAYEERLNRLINRINAQMTDNTSDYVACKIILDELASFIKYEDGVLEEYLRLEMDNTAESADFIVRHASSFTAYGVLMNSKGVCNGISKLFKIVCDRFGVQCACVEAKTLDCREGSSNNHMLNVVEIDGERAFVDLTNCLKRDNLPVVIYDYFLVTQRIISKAFTVEGDFGCNNERLNYYVNNNLHFTSVNDLRLYLSAYAMRLTGAVRCFYDGNKLDDDKLRDLFFEIINYHCRDGYEMQYASVHNGFCTGLIKSSSEV